MTSSKKIYHSFTLVGVLLMLFSSCKKDDVDTNTVKDIDGNVYKTVKIGTQEWFTKNLRTTRYIDGTSIPTGHSDDDWAALTTGAYAVYPHSLFDGPGTETEVLAAYGALYNWYAVETGNLCPSGWRVPADSEWTTLTDYVGGQSVAASKLKSTRTAPVAHPRWESPNNSETDEYGFSALPGGFRSFNSSRFQDTFFYAGFMGYWWSSTGYEASTARSRSMFFGNKDVHRGSGLKGSGYSVRCVRDI